MPTGVYEHHNQIDKDNPRIEVTITECEETN